MFSTQTATRTLWIRAEDLRNRLESWEACTFLDARPRDGREARGPGIPDAVRVRPEQLWIDPDWPTDQLTIVYGAGSRDEAATMRLVQQLREHGFHNAYGLRGGLEAWNAVEQSAERS